MGGRDGLPPADRHQLTGSDPVQNDDNRNCSGGTGVVTAARRAGLVEIPAWVREMEDDTAFMQLVLANAQGELSPLERGLHALAATEKGAFGGVVDAYARHIGRNDGSVHREVCAATVARASHQGDVTPLLARTKHLHEIHSAPEHCWSPLVKRMVDGQWNSRQTDEAVKSVLAVRPPRAAMSPCSPWTVSRRLPPVATIPPKW